MTEKRFSQKRIDSSVIGAAVPQNQISHTGRRVRCYVEALFSLVVDNGKSCVESKGITDRYKSKGNYRNREKALPSSPSGRNHLLWKVVSYVVALRATHSEHYQKPPPPACGKPINSVVASVYQPEWASKAISAPSRAFGGAGVSVVGCGRENAVVGALGGQFGQNFADG
jgi:hypothetical protein